MSCMRMICLEAARTGVSANCALSVSACHCPLCIVNVVYLPVKRSNHHTHVDRAIMYTPDQSRESTMLLQLAL